jgi:hypothetical protein
MATKAKLFKESVFTLDDGIVAFDAFGRSTVVITIPAPADGDEDERLDLLAERLQDLATAWAQ